jgi:hypothetical protein
MAADLALQLAVNNYILNVCKALQACGSVSDIQLVLHSLISFAQLAASNCADAFNVAEVDLDSPLAQSQARVCHEYHRAGQHAVILKVFIFRQFESVAHSLFPGSSILLLLGVAMAAAVGQKSTCTQLLNAFAVMACSANNQSTGKQRHSASASQSLFSASCCRCITGFVTVSARLFSRFSIPENS